MATFLKLAFFINNNFKLIIHKVHYKTWNESPFLETLQAQGIPFSVTVEKIIFDHTANITLVQIAVRPVHTGDIAT